jgi:hypothetical protein
MGEYLLSPSKLTLQLRHPTLHLKVITIAYEIAHFPMREQLVVFPVAAVELPAHHTLGTKLLH